MTTLEAQLTSAIEFLTHKLGAEHKEAIEARRMLVAEWMRSGKYGNSK